MRYLFSRYYFFCLVGEEIIPLDGCPESDILSSFLLVVTSLISIFLYGIVHVFQICRKRKEELRKANEAEVNEVAFLQQFLYQSDPATLTLCPQPSVPVPIPEFGGSFMDTGVRSGSATEAEERELNQLVRREDTDFASLLVVGNVINNDGTENTTRRRIGRQTRHSLPAHLRNVRNENQAREAVDPDGERFQNFGVSTLGV